MAHESFDDAGVAAYLTNTSSRSRSIERNGPTSTPSTWRRPRLVSGHGGWPMSVFLLPDGRPFMAGTYYPPVADTVRSDFTTPVAHDERRLDGSARRWSSVRRASSRALERDSLHRPSRAAPDTLDLAASRRSYATNSWIASTPTAASATRPKFPRPSYVEALLEFDDDEARAAVAATLDAMSRRDL